MVSSRVIQMFSHATRVRNARAFCILYNTNVAMLPWKRTWTLRGGRLDLQANMAPTSPCCPGDQDTPLAVTDLIPNLRLVPPMSVQWLNIQHACARVRVLY